MKLINDKKFLAELDKFGTLYREDRLTFKNESTLNTFTTVTEDLKEILSKHLRDLPNKKQNGSQYVTPGESGYNQCLSDCEDKKT